MIGFSVSDYKNIWILYKTNELMDYLHSKIETILQKIAPLVYHKEQMDSCQRSYYQANKYLNKYQYLWSKTIHIGMLFDFWRALIIKHTIGIAIGMFIIIFYLTKLCYYMAIMCRCKETTMFMVVYAVITVNTIMHFYYEQNLRLYRYYNVLLIQETNSITTTFLCVFIIIKRCKAGKYLCAIIVRN